MSETYKKITKDGSKVQVESAIRDGEGVKISTNYAKKSEIPDVSGKENASNKVTSISSSSTDTQYPSAKAVYSNTVSDITYDSTNKKLKKTKGGTTSDVVTFGANAFTDTTIPTSYVSSVNGQTGAITNVPKYVEDSSTTSSISVLLNTIYPVGSVRISLNANETSFMGGTWELLPANYALWTASSGAYDGTNGTIAAGIPNIKGYMYLNGVEADISSFTGAFSMTKGRDYGGGHAGANIPKVNFNANSGATTSDIYRDDATTVQPPAIKVYVYRRTA